MKRAFVAISMFLVVAGGLAACGGDSDGAATKKDAQKLTAACGEALHISEAACACFGDKAKTDLTGKEAKFVLAMLNKDSEATEKLREELTFQEVVDASAFLTATPTSCASDHGDGN